MPNKIKEEIWDKVVECIAQGLKVGDALLHVGVSPDAHYKKRKDEPAYLARLDQAETKFKLKHINNIADAATKGSWQASAWLLERKYGHEFGQQARLDVTSDGKPLQAPSWFGEVIDIEHEDVEQQKLEQNAGAGNTKE